ncbi:hypothetical protein AB0A99_15525 [Streptomyces fradiae]|uniref:hypothetical protein n=1 Tax=Streptomyces fradiae TaxID=1906 RepID=UPI0033F7CC8A
MPRTDARWRRPGPQAHPRAARPVRPVRRGVGAVWALVLGVLLVSACPGAFEGRGADERAHGGGHVVAGAYRVLAAGTGVSGAPVGPSLPAAGAPAAVVPAVGGSAVVVPAVAGVAVGPVDGEPRTPGCRDGSGARDGGMAPAAPPRGFAPGDLPATPHDGRGDAFCAGWAAWEPDPAGPKRARPALVPPSPMDLSILRV